MTKVIAVGTLTATLFLLLAGSLFPVYPVTWLASTSLEFAAIRTILAVLLLALLITKPPRKMYFRLILGAVALTTICAATALTYQFKLAILDFLILSLAATNFAIAAIEFNPAEETAQHSLKSKKLSASH